MIFQATGCQVNMPEKTRKHDEKIEGKTINKREKTRNNDEKE